MKKIGVELLKTIPLPDWDSNTSKASRGKLLIIGGSRRLPGAVILAARAALRIGCGTVRLAAPESIAVQIGVAVPELMVLPQPETSKGTIAASAISKLLKEQTKTCSAIVLGPGIDEDDETKKAIREILAESTLPMVVDAQALLAFDPKQKGKSTRILTPHIDEFKSLNNGEEIELNDAENVAKNFAKDSNSILVLKGENTIIAEPKGSTYKNDEGNRVLGTAGSGDTLAGIIGGLVAQGMDPVAAAIWGVFFHAKAGEQISKNVGKDGAMASDFIELLPRLQRELRQATDQKN